MPKLKKLHERYHDQGLVIIGIHSAAHGEKMAAFVKQHKIPWANCVDDGSKIKKALLADSYPDYYLIDRSGKLKIADLANHELERAVGALVTGGSKKGPPSPKKALKTKVRAKPKND